MCIINLLFRLKRVESEPRFITAKPTSPSKTFQHGGSLAIATTSKRHLFVSMCVTRECESGEVPACVQ